MIDVSLGTIEEMHAILVQALEQHSLKLRLTSDALDKTEVANTQDVKKVLQGLIDDKPPPLNSHPSF